MQMIELTTGDSSTYEIMSYSVSCWEYLLPIAVASIDYLQIHYHQLVLYTYSCNL